MAEPTYRVEWFHINELPEAADLPYKYEEAYCSFYIRFLDTAPDEPGHCAHFDLNVVAEATAARLGIGPGGRRGYLVADDLTQADLRARIAKDVAQTLDQLPRSAALDQLDQRYVWTDRDFRDEFAVDVPTVEAFEALIEEAFAGVTRGGGVTLHEAMARDDYASAGELAAARAKDPDEDWHDVPRRALSDNADFVYHLDPAGFRYYLPAIMRLSLDATERRGDTPHVACQRLVPLVGVRDHGKGLGAAFEPARFIAEHELTDRQVVCIYAFLCFMATEGDGGVDEEQLPAMRKWRDSARRRGP